MSYELTDYAQREKADANRRMADLSALPLAERQANRAEFARDLKDPELIAERVGWLLAGNYGLGAMLIAQDIESRPRMNRIAALSQTIAAFEWCCTGVFARQAYLGLDKAEQDAVNAAIGGVLLGRE